MVLTDLENGQTARVIKLNCSLPYQKRLLELGLTEGAKITLVRSALFSDPVEIKIRGFCLAIRLSVAEQIQVEQI